MIVQVITYATVSSPSHVKQSSAVSTLGSSSSENIVTSDERPTHIAFGQKVAIPDHILGSKQVLHTLHCMCIPYTPVVQVCIHDHCIVHNYMYELEVPKLQGMRSAAMQYLIQLDF